MEKSIEFCPRCGSNYVVKNGKNKDKQRYICKTCCRSFVDTTNTPVYYSKKTVDTWEKYVDCLLNQVPLNKAANMVSISLKTAFYWRHKLLDAIREHFTLEQLSSNVELGKMYMRSCFKGNHSKEKSFTTCFNDIDCKCKIDKVCVLTAMDDEKHIAAEPVCFNSPSVKDILRVFADKIDAGSRVVTENIVQYKFLCKKCKAIQVVPKAYAKEKLNGIKTVKYEVVNFLKTYRGVATKYLSNYLHLFKYVGAGLKASLLFLKGDKPYYQRNFKERKPIFS